MNYFQQYLAEEFVEDYQDGRISRRQALKMIAKITGSLMMANSFLAACARIDEDPTPTSGLPVTGTSPVQPTPIPAAATAAATTTTQPVASQTTESTSAPTGIPAVYGTVGPNDPDVQAGPVQFPGKDGAALQAYLAQPKGNGSVPVVLVCHENRGLTEHIQDVTRRLAKAGYVGLAVDLLSRKGGTAKVGSDQVPGELGTMSPDQFVQDFLSGWQYLKSSTKAQVDKVGMVGFCFGGGVTWRMAIAMPELRAAVPFYGPPPPVEEVPKIQAAVLAIYGGKDTRITSTAPAIEEAMKKNNKIFEKIIYPNADHAFHNDTGTRYDPQASQDAWNHTIAWFQKYLV